MWSEPGTFLNSFSFRSSSRRFCSKGSSRGCWNKVHDKKEYFQKVEGPFWLHVHDNEVFIWRKSKVEFVLKKRAKTFRRLRHHQFDKKKNKKNNKKGIILCSAWFHGLITASSYLAAQRRCGTFSCCLISRSTKSSLRQFFLQRVKTIFFTACLFVLCVCVCVRACARMCVCMQMWVLLPYQWSPYLKLKKKKKRIHKTTKQMSQHFILPRHDDGRATGFSADTMHHSRV